jgi:hypothetical protein
MGLRLPYIFFEQALLGKAARVHSNDAATWLCRFSRFKHFRFCPSETNGFALEPPFCDTKDGLIMALLRKIWSVVGNGLLVPLIETRM